MLRTRLVWFTVGFSVTAAAIGQFTWRDLLADRYALSSHVKRELDSLEARVNKLESLPTQRSRPAPQTSMVILIARNFLGGLFLACLGSVIIEWRKERRGSA